MPDKGDWDYSRRDVRKIWRYPGVPIPDRLKYRYKEK